MKRKIVIAITGASGSIYARSLLEKLKGLQNQLDEVGVVFSANALEIWKYELVEKFMPDSLFRTYEKTDFNAPFASGSSVFDTMIICPCSMGILGRISGGISDSLITRAADVMLKERRKLILVPRETPYNLIHIENMRNVTLAGGIICPASPSFYNKPVSIEMLVETVTERILKLAGFSFDSYHWGDNSDS